MPAGVKIYLMISLNIIFFAIRFVQKVCKYLFSRKQPQFVKAERKVMKLLLINHIIVPWINQKYFANCITSNIINVGESFIFEKQWEHLLINSFTFYGVANTPLISLTVKVILRKKAGEWVREVLTLTYLILALNHLKERDQ